MDNLDDIDTYRMAHDTFLKLELCLQTLDSIGCKISALHVHTAMTSLQAAMDRSEVSDFARPLIGHFADLQAAARRDFGVGEEESTR